MKNDSMNDHSRKYKNCLTDVDFLLLTTNRKRIRLDAFSLAHMICANFDIKGRIPRGSTNAYYFMIEPTHEKRDLIAFGYRSFKRGARPLNRARCPSLCSGLPRVLYIYIVSANGKGSGEIACLSLRWSPSSLW